MAIPEKYGGSGEPSYKFSAVLTEETMYAMVGLGALRVHMLACSCTAVTAACSNIPLLGCTRMRASRGSTAEPAGPDGRVYNQNNLAQTQTDQTWQSMLVPPEGG
jgi:hypothetical protein